MNERPVLRKNIVSGEWVLVAPGRGRRPQQFARPPINKPTPKNKCVFEDPQKSGNGEPLIWFSREGQGSGPLKKNWAVQVIPNKFPAVVPHESNTCPVEVPVEVYKSMEGIGFHEIVIPRSHTKFFADMTPSEAELMISAYQDRYLFHKKEKCLEYIFIFHNHGSEAGASVWHPHSQILALPVVPQDIRRSLQGAEQYWQKHNTCVHCAIIKQECESKSRIIYQNKEFIVFTPFAPHAAFEVRIYPRVHSPRFENITTDTRRYLADVLTSTLRKLKKGLKNPAYNFFFHTAPIRGSAYHYYHWHIEILPKTSHFAGVELGTGIEVIPILPEIAAAYLKKQ